MRTRVKFCGLVRPEDVDVAVTLGVDALGFVFFPKSPRFLQIEEAAALRRRLPSFVRAVGLFVDADPALVRDTQTRVGLDVLQFHGNETLSTCREAAGSLPWWRAVRMRSQADLLESSAVFGDAECLLLDAFTPVFGGSGTGFDWNWVPPVPARGARRLILSGGLDDCTVGAGIRQVAPFAVDVSSGIQGTDARRKDPARMARFMEEVLRADAVRASALQPQAGPSSDPSQSAAHNASQAA